MKKLFIKKGDQKSVSIASASIVAKCYRDKIIEKLALLIPPMNAKRIRGMEQKSM